MSDQETSNKRVFILLIVIFTVSIIMNIAALFIDNLVSNRIASIFTILSLLSFLFIIHDDKDQRTKITLVEEED